MARDIQTLLAKKGWTGEEVGKALIASLLNDIKYQGQEHNQLFSQADFDKMESSLNTNRDYLAYGVYSDIYRTIVDAYNRGQGLYQQFYNGYYQYLIHLKDAMRADKALEEVENYPLIMTRTQYEKHRQEAQDRLRSLPESFYSLIFSILSSCISYAGDGKKELIPANILKALETTKKEKATNKRILSNYNQDMGEGYYTLPDGRRSDELTEEEWTTALFKANTKDKGYELFFKGADAIREEYKRITGQDFPEATDEEVTQAFAFALEQRSNPANDIENCAEIVFTGEKSPLEWHYYTDTPELSKYDILDQLLGRYSGAYEGDIPEKDQLKEFKTDYPALYEALEAYIKENVPTAKSLKPAQYYKNFISWGELADLNILGFDFVTTDTDIIDLLVDMKALKFADRKRALFRGIAVIQEERSYLLDEQGNYKERSNPIDKLESLDALDREPNAKEKLEKLQENLFKPALQYLYCYNSLIDIIGAVYDISGIEVAKFDTSMFESQLKNFNSLLYYFHANVYGDAEEKTRKRAIIKDLFSPVYAEELKPTEEAITAVKAELSKLGISSNARKTLKDFDTLIAKLGEGA